MATAQASPAATMHRVTPKDVEARLRLSGDWQDAQSALTSEAILTQTAQQEGLSINDKELQQAFNDFRASRNLHKAADTQQWLQSTGLTIEQIEGALEAQILAERVAAKVIPDRQLSSYYNEHPTEFEYARISQIVLKDKGAAKEVALSAREEGEDFAKLARQHSTDGATRCGGGFVGLITRADTAGLPKDVADRVFAAKAGEVVGPFPLHDAQCLVKVEEVGRRPLDDDLRQLLRQQAFGQWMAEKCNGSAAPNDAAPRPAPKK